MEITELQEQIEILRNRLTNGIGNYRAAIQKNLEVDMVRFLFKKIKSNMMALRSAMVKYEKLISDNMVTFTKYKDE